jgi:hypothetical protein
MCMECEVFKKRYSNLLSEETRLERFNNLENLIKEGINQLPKEHAAYFLCEILQNMDGLVESEYDLLFGQVMNYFHNSVTPNIIFLSSIDLEFAVALTRYHSQNIARAYYLGLLDWYRKDLESEGKFHASAIAICIGLSSMNEERGRDWGEIILTYLYEAITTGIKDRDEQLMICESILSSLKIWNSENDLVMQVEKHINELRS